MASLQKCCCIFYWNSIIIIAVERSPDGDASQREPIARRVGMPKKPFAAPTGESGEGWKQSGPSFFNQMGMF